MKLKIDVIRASTYGGALVLLHQPGRSIDLLNLSGGFLLGACAALLTRGMDTIMNRFSGTKDSVIKVIKDEIASGETAITDHMLNIARSAFASDLLVGSCGRMSGNDEKPPVALNVIIISMLLASSCVSVGEYWARSLEKGADLQSREELGFTSTSLQKLCIGGMAQHLPALQQIFYTKSRSHVEEAIRRNIKPIKGILLYGPPGTGKTVLAKNIGLMLGCNRDHIILRSTTSLKNKYYGDTEANVRELFAPALAAQKRYGKKSPLYVIVLDEIDAIISERMQSSSAEQGVCAQFLSSLDGLETLENLLIIGTTNKYNELDKAAIRPGRFDIHLKIDLPDLTARKEILQCYLDKVKIYLDPTVDRDLLAKNTANFSGAELEALVSKANMMAAIRSNNKKQKTDPAFFPNPRNVIDEKITMQDLEEALQFMKKSKRGENTVSFGVL
jgi:hypothetical protein